MKAKPSMLEGIQETPVKKQLESVLDQSHAVSLNNRADKENERDAMLPLSSRTEHVLAIEDESIYKSLGWDDDNDIDDLA
jgi:DNA replication regulator SLD3